MERSKQQQALSVAMFLINLQIGAKIKKCNNQIGISTDDSYRTMITWIPKKCPVPGFIMFLYFYKAYHTFILNPERVIVSRNIMLSSLKKIFGFSLYYNFIENW